MKRFIEFLSRLRPSRKHLQFLPVYILTFCLLAGTARAGVADIISFLQTITNTLQNGIGDVLTKIHTIRSTVDNLHEEVIFPLNVINQAKRFVFATRRQYLQTLSQIRAIPLNSATLVNPAQFEAVFRSANAGTVAQLQAAYTQVYSQVPPANAASPKQRDMIDMDDASAMASLKSSVLADQASVRMLTLADALETESSNSAPGSASMLAAQSQVANLESQAYLAKMLAADLRVEATKLAHANSILKQSAENARNLRLQMQQVVSQP
jgi:hypothetical protein